MSEHLYNCHRKGKKWKRGGGGGKEKFDQNPCLGMNFITWCREHISGLSDSLEDKILITLNHNTHHKIFSFFGNLIQGLSNLSINEVVHALW